MSDTKKNDGLIASEDHRLRLRSGSLVRRGLDQIAKANPSEQEEDQDDAPRISEAEIAQQLEGFAEHLEQVEEHANRDPQWKAARADDPTYQSTTYEKRKANQLAAFEAYLRDGKDGLRKQLAKVRAERDDPISKDKVDGENPSDKLPSRLEVQRQPQDAERAGFLYSLGKAHMTGRHISQARSAFEESLKTQKDSALCEYALGLVAALAGDDLAVLEQEEALAAKGLTSLSDDLFQFLNKHSNYIAEFAEDEEFKALMCQLVESKIQRAELLTGMAQEFDRIASDQ